MKSWSDRDWIYPASVLIAVQYCAATIMAFAADFFRRPPLLESITVAIPFVATALAYLILKTRLPLKEAIDANLLAIRAVITGGLLLVLQITLLTWLKMLLPYWSGGFWADPILARLDHYFFGIDPWRLARFAGGEHIITTAYAAWLFVIPSALYLLLLTKPSSAKSTALLSAFGIIAVCAFSQFLVPSAGPLFFDLAGWGNRFEGIEGPAALAREWLWRFHTDGVVKAGIGISAMPSMHVALALWLVVIARKYHWILAALAFCYFALILLGSVYLGLHYASDGIFSVIAVAVIFRITSHDCLSRANLLSRNIRDRVKALRI